MKTKRIYRNRVRRKHVRAFDGYSRKEMQPEVELWMAVLHQAYLDLSIDLRGRSNRYDSLLEQRAEIVGEYNRFCSFISDQRQSFLDSRKAEETDHYDKIEEQLIYMMTLPKSERSKIKKAMAEANKKRLQARKIEWDEFKKTWDLFLERKKQLKANKFKAQQALYAEIRKDKSGYSNYVNDRMAKQAAANWFSNSRPNHGGDDLTAICTWIGRDPVEAKKRALDIINQQKG